MTDLTNLSEPPLSCDLCPRLVDFRRQNERAYPDFFNAPVPSFGDDKARLLIVGLAPGLKGANWSGRPFTGDYAGDLLYATLAKFGWSRGTYDARPDDGLALDGAMITNAVRCVPPQNKPTTSEIKECRPLLINRMAELPNLSVILVLGRIAHDQVLTAIGAKRSAFPFGHGADHEITLPDGRTVRMVDSYHCSRYNTNTGRLTEAMFDAVFETIAR